MDLQIGTYGTSKDAIIEELKDSAGIFVADYDYDGIFDELVDEGVIVGENQNYYWNTDAEEPDMATLFCEHDTSGRR